MRNGIAYNRWSYEVTEDVVQPVETGETNGDML